MQDGNGNATQRIYLPGGSSKAVTDSDSGTTTMTFATRALSLDSIQNAKLEMAPDGYYTICLNRLLVRWRVEGRVPWVPGITLGRGRSTARGLTDTS